MTRNQDVPIEIRSRHEHVSERQRDYAVEKAHKLVKFHNRISRIQFVVDGAHEQPEVEVIVHVDSGGTLVAKEHAAHFRQAIDAVVDKMERQLKRDQEKRRNHKGDGPRGGPGAGTPPGGDEDTYEDIVRRDLDS